MLARRLAVLLGAGLLHHFLLWNGDILAIYAVVGLVVLLPSSWLPRWAVMPLGALALAASLAVYGGGVTLVPGLFLLGSALTRHGVVDRLEGTRCRPAVIGLALAPAAAAALWWQLRAPVSGSALGVAGLLMAGTYVCVLLSLLRTRFRSVLRRVFEPLGRMALTNYLTATVLVLSIGQALGRPDTWTPRTTVGIGLAVLLLQWVWSSLWLGRHRQGPLEWLWRWATWARRPPLGVGVGGPALVTAPTTQAAGVARRRL